jgi:hypothetical protein
MHKTSQLYDDDFYAWTEVQAAELRKLSARPELSNLMDWENVIEEVETLGRGELSGVRSKLVRALEHILKAYCDADSLSLFAWKKEVRTFLRDVRSDYRRSMKQQFDIDKLWASAASDAFEALEGYIMDVPAGIAKTCPFALDQLLDERFTFDLAIVHMHATRGGNAPFEFPANSVQ